MTRCSLIPYRPLVPTIWGNSFPCKSAIIVTSSNKNTLMQSRKGVITQPLLVTQTEAESIDVSDTMKLKVKALVTVKINKTEYMKEIMLSLIDGFHGYSNPKGVILQLISTEVDPKTMEPKLSKKATLDWPRNMMLQDAEMTQEVEFLVDSNFGRPGAITVSNKYRYEFYLVSITIEDVIHFSCNSWIQQDDGQADKRIFFTNKGYLPRDTPEGLKRLREKELQQLRGDGNGVRRFSERIYDFDLYNDLGNPDEGEEFTRPTLGGIENPHPRRCRTGRPPTGINANLESPVSASLPMYVPRDEAMTDCKRGSFNLGKLKGMLRNVVPYFVSCVTNSNVIERFSEIEDIYKERSSLQIKHGDGPQLKSLLPNLEVMKMIQESIQEYLKFDIPKIISRDNFCSLRDVEFGRQVVAGLHPLTIQRLRVFPPVSKLNPSMYGPPESALREEHITSHLNGMSVQQAIEEAKLFILDYHDMYLPFVNQINGLDDCQTYATRTLFFLTPMGTLKPIAIELSLPSGDLNSPSKQVLMPPVDETSNWLWELGKAHVCSADSGVHQLVHHWLCTHACMEPFIIAAHRQMSIMHPVFKLLDPHMRYTMDINAIARESLINGGGIIESNFTPGKYSMQITCAAYRDWWRFDMAGLPADLIRRGVAIPDQTQPHGLRLLIEDYPYANDGLLIWSAIETMVETYVNYYYLDASMVNSDTELQAWYHESINMGHADLSHATWWPPLSTPEDLISILTTIIWIVSAEHAALNFGQYFYGGYVPDRSPLMRRPIPKENDPIYESFVADPQGYFLSCLPSLFQATQFMAIIDIISAHSPDEEYLGERKDLSSWSGDVEITEAFYEFSMEIKRIEKEIERRNADRNLRNRCGPGIPAYELLIPKSRPGVTGRGVPNSITI